MEHLWRHKTIALGHSSPLLQQEMLWASSTWWVMSPEEDSSSHFSHWAFSYGFFLTQTPQCQWLLLHGDDRNPVTWPDLQAAHLLYCSYRCLCGINTGRQNGGEGWIQGGINKPRLLCTLWKSYFKISLLPLKTAFWILNIAAERCE